MKTILDSTPQSLLDRLRDTKNSQAQADLVDIYSDWIRGKLHFLGIPAQEVDDLFQDSIRIILENIGQFQSRQHVGAFRGWLKGILLNRVRYYWRESQQRNVPENIDQIIKQLSDPYSALSQQWDNEHNRHILQRLLHKLQQQSSPESWQIFEELVVRGTPAAQVATVRGVTISTVWMTKSRMYRKLRELGKVLMDEFS
ncbi:MAG: RNA polymerase sigma factor [Zavarzinella sp.]